MKGGQRRQAANAGRAPGSSRRHRSHGASHRPQHPGFDRRFELPQRACNDTTLLTAALLVVEAAEPVTDRFIEFGLASDFVPNLKVLVGQFATAVSERQDGRDGRTEASAAIEEALARGFDALVRLDVIVTNRLQSDPAKLAVWKENRRVDYTKRARRVSATRVPLDEQPVAPSVTPEPGPVPVADVKVAS
jgi:hypothetical protein